MSGGGTVDGHAALTATPDVRRPNPLLSRYDQMFPVLSAGELARVAAFGEAHRFGRGERLLETGKSAPGMFVILSGHVAITQRDGLGHVSPVVDHGPGQFIGEVGQLSGRAALVDADAEDEVEALVIQPERLRALLVAEADLGERIMRALILRRVGLIQSGVGGPSDRRRAEPAGRHAAAEFPRPQRPSASPRRPRHRSGGGARSSTASPSLHARPALGRARRRRASCAIRPRPSWRARIGMTGARLERQGLRRRHRRRRPGGPGHRRLRRLGGSVASSCSTRAPMAARPAPARASRTISAFRPASPAQRLPGAPSCRRRSSAPTS